MNDIAAAGCSRVHIGIWTEFPAGARWSNEGMTRLVGFLIEGAATRGTLHFHILVPTGARQAAWDDLTTLAAVEGRDWTLHAPPPADDVEAPATQDPAPETKPDLQTAAAQVVPEAVAAPSRLASWLRSLPPGRLGAGLGTGAMLYAVAAPLRDLVRPPWRVLWRFVVQPLSARLRLAQRLHQDPLSSLGILAIVLERLHFSWARRTAAELRAWNAEVDRARNPPPPPPPPPKPVLHPHQEAVEQLIVWTNENIRVAAWISLFCHYTQAVRLRGPKAVIFPDAIPLAFPELASELAWTPGGPYEVWRSSVQRGLAGVDRVITFSRHVGRNHATSLFGVSADRIVAIPHAPPDLARLLPFVQNRRGNSETRRKAAQLLRAEMVGRGWDYLREFPFEQVPYAVVSTQDRITKNIVTAATAIGRLLREQRLDLKLITTATVVDGATWSRLPSWIASEQLKFDVVSTPDLPREVHAALYHCAAFAIHPSLLEGGQGPFPFYESVSVGTPCLMARGPHTEELLETAPELADFVFDPLDVEGLMTLIVNTLNRRDDVLRRQTSVYERLLRRTWGEVSEAYAEAALGCRLADVRQPAKGLQESRA